MFPFVVVWRCMIGFEWNVVEKGYGVWGEEWGKRERWCGWIFMMAHTSLTPLNYCTSPITFKMFERKTDSVDSRRGYSYIRIYTQIAASIRLETLVEFSLKATLCLFSLAKATISSLKKFQSYTYISNYIYGLHLPSVSSLPPRQ